MSASGDLKNVLAQLRERYLATSGTTLAALGELAEQLERSPDAPEVVGALRRELHRVRGTAGSYGFHEASRLAAALEPLAVRWAADRDLDRGRRASIVRGFVDSLALALRPDDQAADPAVGQRTRLFLVDVPEGVAPRITAEGVHRGYHVEIVAPDALAGALEGVEQAAIVAAADARFFPPAHHPVVLLQHPDTELSQQPENFVVLEVGTDPRVIFSAIETRAVRSPLAGVTILVIEDDEDLASLLRALGERHGMFVTSRPTAEGLTDALVAQRPSALLMDINLPGLSGLDATRALRADDRFRDLPVILMSADTSAETRGRAFAMGADDFQSKPVAPEELMRRIERTLDAQRQRKVARGEHPVTGLLLPDRAMQVFDGALGTLAARAEPASLALLRPTKPVTGVAGTAAWHRELRLLAGLLGTDGVRAGFRDEIAVVLLLPMSAPDAVARLELLAEAAEADVVPWRAGVAELPPGAEPSATELSRLAEEAWYTAQERDARVYVWDPAASGVAPDVIVVEDDDALADLVTFALSARGLVWVRYADGPAALAGLRAMRVHGRSPIVLLDVDLPGLDGFSLFERLRVERPGVFRVVFVTVHASEADQLRAIRAGALDYLTKPVSLRVLMAKIVSWRAGAPTT